MEVSGQFHVPASLSEGKDPSARIEYEAGWTPELVRCGTEQISTSPCRESNPGRPARRYTD
jgi:hypothetical protein